MKRKPQQLNHYETYSTAHYNVIFTDGKLKEIGKNFLKLKEGTKMKIIIDLKDLNDDDFENISKVVSKTILEKESILKFRLKVEFEWLIFVVLLKQGLNFTKKNNKQAVISSSKCVLLDTQSTSEYTGIKEFDSINQAFMNLSIFFKPDGKYHNCNVYNTFFTEEGIFPEKGLRHLEKGDLLVFYCGLKGWTGCTKPEALYVVGYLVVDVCGTYPNLVKQHSKDWVSMTFSANHHIIHKDIKGCVYERRSKSTGQVTEVRSELVLVKGDENWFFGKFNG